MQVVTGRFIGAAIARAKGKPIEHRDGQNVAELGFTSPDPIPIDSTVDGNNKTSARAALSASPAGAAAERPSLAAIEPRQANQASHQRWAECNVGEKPLTLVVVIRRFTVADKTLMYASSSSMLLRSA